MSAENGSNGPSSRILPLNGRRPMHKGGDFITHDQCAAMIVGEASKIHDFYLNQIPKFTATMIQDALVSYGLLVITPAPEALVVAEDATAQERGEVSVEARPGMEAAPLSSASRGQTPEGAPQGTPAGVPCE